ncbi:MAG: MerR family transcriptional regulator [Nanoarchaeota archaeon]
MSIGRKYLSIKQASSIIGVTPLTLRNWDKLGKLCSYRNPVNNYRYYRVDQIEAFLRQMESSRDRFRKIKIADIS